MLLPVLDIVLPLDDFSFRFSVDFILNMNTVRIDRSIENTHPEILIIRYRSPIRHILNILGIQEQTRYFPGIVPAKLVIIVTLVA